MHFLKLDLLKWNASLLFMTVLLVGCSGDSDARPAVEIKGTVTLDGSPLQQASIQFTSPKTGESAYANLNENGQYSIAFPKADIGSAYEVTISAPVVEEENAMALAEQPQKKTTTKIPAQYSKRTTSDLSVRVEQAGTNEANFDLKSK